MGVIITLAVVAFILVVTTLVISAVLCNGLHRDQKAEDEEQMKFIESLKRKGKA